MPFWISACFCASGAAGLIYEVVWSKQLSYLLGNSLHAASAVVAVFLAGLAIGARVLGVPLVRLGKGARTYAFLEMAVALFGLGLLPLLRFTNPLVGSWYRSMGGESLGFACARFALLIVLLLPPSALMGATLPVLVATAERMKVGAGLAWLYAINTLGAVIGSLIAGFYLLPNLGLSTSTYLAATLNLIVAAIAWRAAKTSGESGEPKQIPSAPESTVPLDARTRGTVAVLFTLSGFAALAFQMAWVRLFSLVLGSSVYSFSAVLGVYLSGISLGSFIIVPWLRRVSTLTGFGILQLGLAATAAIAIQNFPNLPQRMLDLGVSSGARWESFLIAQAGLVTLVIGIPCIILGALFPIAAHLLQSRGRGHAAGVAYATNTIGAIAGSLAAGYLLIPRLGVQGTHLLGLTISGGIGIVSLCLARKRENLRGTPLTLALGALIASVLFVSIAPSWDARRMSAGTYRPRLAALLNPTGKHDSDSVRRVTDSNKVILYREGQNASVMLGTNSTGDNLWLRVGGKVEASMSDMETQVLFGVLPGVMVESGTRSLVIGHGSGITTASVLASGSGPTEVVEMEAGIIEASRYFHEKGKDPLDDPRTHLFMGDARTHLTHSAGSYGLIVSEPSNPWIAGVNNLFTTDFYKLVRKRLEPKGVFCQWIQLYELSPDTFTSLLRSFLEVFPEGQAFYLRRMSDLILIAAPKNSRLDLERLSSPEARRLLKIARISDPSDVSAFWAGPLSSLSSISKNAPFNTDDHPVVEYLAPRDLVATARYALSGHPDVIGKIPFVPDYPSNELFSAWTKLSWYQARTRYLTGLGNFSDANLSIAAAKRDLTDSSTELENLSRFVQKEEQRIKGQSLFDQAAKFAAENDVPRARSTFENAVKVDPDNLKAWVALAQYRRAAGDIQGTNEALQHARQSNDSEVLADADLVSGLLAMSQEDHKSAVEYFASAQKHIPKDADAYILEAQAHLQMKNPAGASTALRRGLVEIPNSKELQTELKKLR